MLYLYNMYEVNLHSSVYSVAVQPYYQILSRRTGKNIINDLIVFWHRVSLILSRIVKCRYFWFTIVCQSCNVQIGETQTKYWTQIREDVCDREYAVVLMYNEWVDMRRY